MESFDYISIALGVYLAVCGLASIFTGKVYSMGKSASKYTEESLKKFSRPFGVSNLVSGVGIALFHVLDGELFKIGTFSVSAGMAILVAAIVICIGLYIASKKILVKK